MMIAVGVTQRVDVVANRGERRDALDQAWCELLSACGLLPVPLPNARGISLELFKHARCGGLLLTGGNDLCEVGGSAPERDEAERALLDHARAVGLPVLGVCRGMQVIQQACGVPLEPVEGHVTSVQEIAIEGKRSVVNSYHHWGTRETSPELEVWAVADDGVVKAVRHRSAAIAAIMWHPERLRPFAERDLSLIRGWFAGSRTTGGGR